MNKNINPATLGRLASTLTPQPVSWLWQDRIPIGHLTLLEGQPGSSKSLLTLYLAACVSNTRPIANATSCCPPGGVILTPRLIAACGDPHHLLFLTTLPSEDKSAPQRPLTLPEDLDLLEAAITYRHATLLIIHPLSSVTSPSASTVLANRTAQTLVTSHNPLPKISSSPCHKSPKSQSPTQNILVLCPKSPNHPHSTTLRNPCPKCPNCLYPTNLRKSLSQMSQSLALRHVSCCCVKKSPDSRLLITEALNEV